MKKGTEPPPHSHEREQEMFYVLEGMIDVYLVSNASDRLNQTMTRWHCESSHFCSWNSLLAPGLI
jgi:hypothetical protein